jgi:C_GCAxxG_C_C family probable redox protein
MTRADSARASMEGNKMNCAQSVLTAYCADLGLDRLLALKIAVGFGGGMGSTGKTCGAVTAAYMVLGLKQDLRPETAQQVRQRINELIKEFNRKFIEIHGSAACKDLLGLDLSVPGNREIARGKGLFITVCPKLVHDSVEILEGMG